nr:hypothetical protein [Tanacetum cinerariifolium]
MDFSEDSVKKSWGKNRLMKAVRRSSHVSIVPSLSSSSHVFASPNIKKVTEVIDVENWRVDISRVLRWIVSLIKWNSSVSSTKSLIQ